LRERIYASTTRQYQETYVNDNQWADGATISFDPDSGATLPILSEKTLTISSLTAGPSSIGALAPGSSFDSLLSDEGGSTCTWNGSYLELVIEFDSLQIVNALRLELPGYQGLQCDGLLYSPDGTFEANLLTEYNPEIRSLDSSTS